MSKSKVGWMIENTATHLWWHNDLGWTFNFMADLFDKEPATLPGPPESCRLVRMSRVTDVAHCLKRRLHGLDCDQVVGGCVYCGNAVVYAVTFEAVYDMDLTGVATIEERNKLAAECFIDWIRTAGKDNLASLVRKVTVIG